MPTYAFTSTRRLDADEKTRLVESVTAIHAKEAAAPRCFVQVIFYAVEEGSMFVGGEPVPAGHVWVNAQIRAGRTKEQKTAILTRVMRETAEVLDVPAASVWVYVSDVPAQSMAEFGAVLPEPGGEDAWFEALPAELRDRLKAAA